MITSIMLVMGGIILLLINAKSAVLRQVSRTSAYVGVVLAAVVIVKVLVLD